MARAGGAGGSQFYSTLWVTNLGGAAANIHLDFLRQGQANPTPVTRTDTLGAGATRRYDNVVEQLFGVSGVGGAVRVRSNQEIFVSSRTYDRPSGAEFVTDLEGPLSSRASRRAFAHRVAARLSRLQEDEQRPSRKLPVQLRPRRDGPGQAVAVTVRLRNEDGGVTHTQVYDMAGARTKRGR